ncbi:MAG: acetylglutamate kinase [Candidatus Tectomicrobia bacterium]|nr:acetylglutamate kinase [Candidatus Tectomicrobia bacterium]
MAASDSGAQQNEGKVRDPLATARTLVEALPYIQKFAGKRIVIKYGGHAMVDARLKESFAQDIVLMRYVGISPIVVHGGGPQIGETLAKMGKESHFIQGLRVTDHETLDIVEMVLGGKVNKEIVALLNRHGGRAVGLSGKDGQLILASKMNLTRAAADGGAPEIIDLGMVGSVRKVNPGIITVLDANGYIPVVAPIGVDAAGASYNINADTVASKIASALQAEKLLLLTDVPGILDAQQRIISSLRRAEIDQLIADGTISGGMLPKVEACLSALDAGVAKTHIVDGRVEHAVLLEIFTDHGVGTEITQS